MRQGGPCYRILGLGQSPACSIANSKLFFLLLVRKGKEKKMNVPLPLIYNDFVAVVGDSFVKQSLVVLHFTGSWPLFCFSSCWRFAPHFLIACCWNFFGSSTLICFAKEIRCFLFVAFSSPFRKILVVSLWRNLILNIWK